MHSLLWLPVWQLEFSQDGKPYILSITAGEAFPDPRNQGYNIAVQTTFKSKEDMTYYDTECEAHKKLKSVAGPVHEGLMMIYFDAAATEGCEKLQCSLLRNAAHVP